MTLYYDEAANESTLRLYVDGSEIMSHTVEGKSLRNPLTGRPFVVGGVTWSSWPKNQLTRLFYGQLDEVRISNVQRSAAWLAASYHNQKPESTMLRCGGVEPPLGTLIIIR